MVLKRTGAVAGFAACLAAVFFLPYLFPPHNGISLSVMAGFSNRAAQVTLLFGGLLFALLTRGWHLRLPEATTRVREPWRLLVPAAAVALVSLASLYLWHWASNMGPYDEGIYFLDRFSNQLAGGSVYRDFDFDYGPLLYYPSWWIASALRIPVGHAYYLFCLLQWVAGVLLLWRVITALRGRTLDRAFTFTVLVLSWFTSITDQGAQYTPLRFVLTSACALWIHSLWRRSADRGVARPMRTALLVAVLCFTLLLLYSPEQGLSFFFATILFFAIGVRQRTSVAPLASFALFCSAIVVLAARLHLLQSMLTFAGGSFNLPVLAGAQTVFLVSMLLAAACIVVHAFYRGEPDRPEIYLIALALVSIPAAFGRADAGHIFINTMPALLVVTLALLQQRTSRLLVVLGWCVYVTIAFSTHMRHQVNVLMHSWPRLEKLPPNGELPPAGATLRAPIRYFSYLDGQFGPRVKTGRFYGYDLVFPGLAERKIAELAAHPRDLIVVPLEYEQACKNVPPEIERQSLRSGFATFYAPHLHAVPNVKEPLCAYIRSHYVASPFRVPREEYRVMQPRAFPLAPAFAPPPGATTPASPPQSTALPTTQQP